MEKKDYSKTVNLPKTSFSMKADLQNKEPAMVSQWDDSKLYGKLLERHKDNKYFILHDGPPYANGNIHIGHVLNKVLKDIVVKYKTMNGYRSPYIPGWDCHGLPIEHQLFKTLKMSKHNIDILEFRKKAAEFAMNFVNIQRDEFKRLGILGDWENPYITMSPFYESSIIRVFKELVAKGFIYRAKKPIYWCAQCETALADAEVEYADHTSPSIFVKFPVISFPSSLLSLNSRLSTLNSSVVIWTTTPWTLPANVALVFHPSENYVIANVKSTGDNIIVAEKLLKTVMEKIGVSEYSVIETIKGCDFEGMKCRNVLVGRDSIAIVADFVTMEDGTGVVHSAPGHGMEDYINGLKYNLPILAPVDNRGQFTEEVPEFKGQKVFAANPGIINRLNELGLLLSQENITHSYPHCWRCKHAVIFRATEQWFMNVEHNNLRSEMLKAVKDVKWIPAYGINRITGMLETRPDWCLSRQRYWGVPIPAIYCEDCGKAFCSVPVIEKFEEFIKKEGSNCWFTRPVEDFIPAGFTCECGGKKFKKENDIFDVWFDSGVSHEAVLAANGLPWPADIYLEGSDQHRGWFQTSLIPAVALRGHAPYKDVLTHGFAVDSEGKKMSKSQGNVVAPQEIFKKYGAEILRLWAGSSDYSEDVRISDVILKQLVETYRKIRNTIRFILGNLYDYDNKAMQVQYSDLEEIDRWALHRLQTIIKEVTDAYENYEYHKVISTINRYSILDLSGFYLDILKDRLYTFRADSRERRSAQTVMYEIATSLIKMLPPILSFTCEEAWKSLHGEDSSVFLQEFPKVNQKYISVELESSWQRIMEIREKVNLEIEASRKLDIVGSSLEASLAIKTSSEDLYGFLKKYENSLASIFIVSQVKLTRDKSFPELQVEVVHSEGKKCARCWNWPGEVNEEELCPRCQKNLL